jgi:hypothetical protein
MNKKLIYHVLLVFSLLVCGGNGMAQERLGFSNTKEPFVWGDNVPVGCPFVRATDYNEMVFSGRYSNYGNADTWYPSWASDGNLYSPWTDGYILKGHSTEYVLFDGAHPDYPCNSLDFMGRKAATAQAKIVGDDPMNLIVENIPSRVEASPLPYGGRYPCGSLVYNGIWYYGTYCLTNRTDTNCDGVGWSCFGPFVGFRVSKDNGKTWTESPNTPDKPIFGENPKNGPIKIGTPHFVDFGKNMQYSPDGYAYLTAHGGSIQGSWNNWIQGDEIYLIRVKPSVENINNMKAYQYFAGRDKQGKAIWTNDFAKIKPLLKWNNHLGCVTATYNPGLKKFLMCISRGVYNGKGERNRYDLMILESDKIDGQWKLIKYMDRFGPVAYFVNIPSKFISKDGRTMWLCYSANWNNKNVLGNPQGSHYSLSLHEFSLRRNK